MKTKEGRPNLPARFFKVILPSSTSKQKLKIPDKFVEKYGHGLSDVVSLRDPVGGAWCVGLKKMENSFWLHNDWEKFVCDHSINDGYFLLFKYKGNSTFKVNIFDLSATEVEYPLNTSHNFERANRSAQNSISEKEGSGDDESAKNTASPYKPVIATDSPRRSTPSGCRVQVTNNKRQGCQTRRGVKRGNITQGSGNEDQRTQFRCRYITRSKHKMEDAGVETPSKKLKNVINDDAQEPIPCTDGSRQSGSNEKKSSLGVKSQTGKKAVDSTGKDLSKNPCFEVVLKPSSLSPKYSMFFSSTICPYLPRTSNCIDLLDSEGNKWLLRFIDHKGYGDKCITSGWRAFAREKKLEVGDTCIFEPIPGNKNILKVSTFHKNPKLTATDWTWEAVKSREPNKYMNHQAVESIKAKSVSSAVGLDSADDKGANLLIDS